MKTFITVILIIAAVAVLLLVAGFIFCFYLAGEIMRGFEEWEGGRNDTET